MVALHFVHHLDFPIIENVHNIRNLISFLHYNLHTRTHLHMHTQNAEKKV